MNTRRTALARSRTYGFLGEIFLDGWTPRALGVVQKLPWDSPPPSDPDQRAARHQQVLGRAVPPYESVFRSTEGLLGGVIAQQLRDAYWDAGFRYGRTDVEPDHVGLQCSVLSFLCAAEADAHRDGVDATRLVDLQRTFIEAHLGTWAAAFRVAVERQGVSEWSEAAGLLAELVRDHAPSDGVAGEPEDVLADPRHGLKDVAAYLLVPARCGMWLGVDDIQRVAARSELACGFGRRPQMMESLWFSAVDHERVPQLVTALRMELDAWQVLQDPRLEATGRMLDRLVAASL